ncbi:hypothetical protein NY2A_b648L [Paramecium bursaria Chlorella virus NY2A]|uniref:Uncharacterized protein b648L n=1 Tax=Paramecium bursaria Chlorella virus NY2A TaxID=46021 RepID=A7IXH3_PBCVN|nr:hypothetical protein NY2A_b648L [Paramecium bursaria Chlorella virus NY2A]ABT15047.1 hypothetical protein NY2A_b648L [Paramecium bursaria Chlorella virus NY2A]
MWDESCTSFRAYEIPKVVEAENSFESSFSLGQWFWSSEFQTITLSRIFYIYVESLIFDFLFVFFFELVFESLEWDDFNEFGIVDIVLDISNVRISEFIYGQMTTERLQSHEWRCSDHWSRKSCDFFTIISDIHLVDTRYGGRHFVTRESLDTFPAAELSTYLEHISFFVI